LHEIGDQVPVHEKARAENLVADARQALEERAPLDRLRSLTSELQQVYHALAVPRADGDGDGGGPATPSAADDDDVIDADFTVS
jgi:molecular chaperone DnaK